MNEVGELGCGFGNLRRVPHSASNSGFRLGFAQAGYTVTIVPLAALLKQCGALEALQDIAFGAGCPDGAKTSVL